MAEDKTPAVEETVSEAPATEISQDALIEKLQAEQAYSQTQRRKKQDAETRLAEFEKKFATAEEDKLKKKEEFKTLYEQASSKVESLTANADKWTKYEETRRTSLLESHPEEDRERLSGLDLDTLEYVTDKITTTKANAPEVAGNPRKDYKPIDKDWTTMSPKDQRDNWDDIVASAIEKGKAKAGSQIKT